jgi:hypothetical protein
MNIQKTRIILAFYQSPTPHFNDRQTPHQNHNYNTKKTGTGSTKHRAQPNGGQSTRGPNLFANPKRMSLKADPLLIGAGQSIAKGSPRNTACVHAFLLTHPSPTTPPRGKLPKTDRRAPNYQDRNQTRAEYALAGLPRWLWLWLCAFPFTLGITCSFREKT